MAPRKVSMKDVAERAGVSLTTVSFIMNERSHAAIPEETRERVMRAVRDLGYVRNAAGRRLGSGKSHTLGFVLPSAEHVRTDAFVPQFLVSFNEVCHQHHFNLLVHAAGSTSRPDTYGDLVRANEIDGLFIVNPRDDDRQIDALLDSGFPVVADPVRDHPNACGVGIDNLGAARTAVGHLLGLGHRRIACVNYGPPRFLSVAARCAGYRQALEEAGIAYDERLVVWADFSHESGRAAAAELLARGSRPTAIFAANDTVAIGVLRALRERGVRAPADMALASIDDIPAARFLDPSLTTVRVPANDFGRLAGEMLISLVYGERPEPRHVILPTELVVRESGGSRISP
ncbi:MAG TPA: LacI family DNA-binding transcriptional regulator [Spirochaetia bacterium]|nr:LacI family DNA-binding transcriptional regulator [Spirochaetia bacterium]